jgi:hypothetical protein
VLSRPLLLLIAFVSGCTSLTSDPPLDDATSDGDVSVETDAPLDPDVADANDVISDVVVDSADEGSLPDSDVAAETN